ncbi:MAG: precorrin-8X methylmutase [Rhodospirillales bacterium]|nr:precorrin-8X methylmutase [Rhodospirillales bacterium]
MQDDTSPYTYIRDPAEIYRRSFATVRAEANLAALPDDIAGAAIRLIHACGMPDIVDDLKYHADAVQAGRRALIAGAPVLADAEMVAAGIIRARLPADNRVICRLNDPRTPAHAATIANTRSAAAVDFWLDDLAGAVVVIGNAPTALFRLLELLHQGAAKPAVILGFPVGFIGAAESKQALAEFGGNIPFMTLSGRRGGSAIASAAVNALSGDLP